jgi:hypothetical protein
MSARGRLGTCRRTEPGIRISFAAAICSCSERSRIPDPNLRRLVADLCAASGRFAALWEARAVGAHQADRKTIEHPEVGPVTLDRDVLTVLGSDLRIVAYTAA